MVWDDPQVALFLRRLASFSRLVRFDRRGTGASDPLPANPLPAWESYTEELQAVMDAAGSEQAALLATGPEAGPMALFFAASRPERITALILVDGTARYLTADDHPIGFPPEAIEEMVARVEELWGTEEYTRAYAPSHAEDERFRRWSARVQRAIAPSDRGRALSDAGDQHHHYGGAEHLIRLGNFPTDARWTGGISLVGTREGQAAAQRDATARVLNFLGSLLDSEDVQRV